MHTPANVIRVLSAILLTAGVHGASAATCVWNNPGSGDWSVVGNWNNCADAPGPSTRTPGSNDVAVLANGTATLTLINFNPTVAEFELGIGGVLSVVGGNIPTVTVNTALRLAGGRTTTQLGINQLKLILAAGGAGSLSAPTTLEGATFFDNNGTLALGSTNGTALTLAVAAELRNLSVGQINFNGGDSRLLLDGAGTLVNFAGGAVTINGNMRMGRATSATNNSRLINFGTINMTGPGTLDMTPGTFSAFFQQAGNLIVSNATLLCSEFATDRCRYSPDGSYTDVNTSIGTNGSSLLTRLDNATLDLGDSTILLTISTGSVLSGTGTIDAKVQVNGTLAPGAVSGLPYGALGVTGAFNMGDTGTLDFDLGGSTPGSFDSLQVAGAASVGDFSVYPGRGTLRLRLAPGYAPALGESVPVMAYPSISAGSAFNRTDDNVALDFAARFDATVLRVFPAPRISIDSPSLIEGASGETLMQFNVRLSQASALPVTVTVVSDSLGTAISGATPTGDWSGPLNGFAFAFAPGETLKTQDYNIHGDTVVEADESFFAVIRRNSVVNAAIVNGYRGNPRGLGTILTDELPANTRFVLVGKDTGAPAGRKIRRYTTTGMFIDTWNDRMGNGINLIVTGMCFAPDGDVLATRFAFSGPILYSRFGAIRDEEFGKRVPSQPPYFSNHESCVYDGSGNVYIGQAGISSSPDVSVPVVKLDRSGDLLDTFVLPTGPRGTDWIDLAPDNCTLYYTSEDVTVRRYNVCTRQVLPVLTSALTEPYCYALRVRPNREVLVACQEAVHRLSPNGANLQTYTRASIGETNAQGLFALNLDPDGSSFWTAGGLSGNVYRVDIATGAVLATFNSGPGGVSGLAIYDEVGDDGIFADGFEPVSPPAPEAEAFTSPPPPLLARPQPVLQFWPPVDDMPHYVPTWMSLIAE